MTALVAQLCSLRVSLIAWVPTEGSNSGRGCTFFFFFFSFFLFFSFFFLLMVLSSFPGCWWSKLCIYIDMTECFSTVNTCCIFRDCEFVWTKHFTASLKCKRWTPLYCILGDPEAFSSDEKNCFSRGWNVRGKWPWVSEDGCSGVR